VPDVEPALREYERGATSVSDLNWLFHMRGQHKHAYDERELSQILGLIGFVAIERREFDSDLDLEMRREGSLRLKADKPIAVAERPVDN
jgi:hypothetical protein